jgi:hypothetical protein
MRLTSRQTAAMTWHLAEDVVQRDDRLELGVWIVLHNLRAPNLHISCGALAQEDLNNRI